MMLRLIGVAILAMVLLLAGESQQAQAVGPARAVGPVPAPGLFQNYYVPPYAGGVGAQLYVSPRPVPPHVGWTYITYQGLMPHEFLYKHHRGYWTRRADGGWTQTTISWR